MKEKRNAIASFMESYSSVYVSGEWREKANVIANEISCFVGFNIFPA